MTRHAKSLAKLVLCFIAVSIPGTSSATEPWADSSLPIEKDLAIWLDASRINAGIAAANGNELKNKQTVSVWPDASGNGRDVIQSDASRRPRFITGDDFQAVRFGGAEQCLQRTASQWQANELTVFVVAATYSNPDAFSGWLSFSSNDTNDYLSGLNIDQTTGSPATLQVISVEGAGQAGASNLLTNSHRYGEVVQFCLRTVPGSTTLWLNGQQQGSRDRADNSPISLENFVLGARRFTHGGPPEPRGFFHGDIAEVLVYSRGLDHAERESIQRYLEHQYASVPDQPIIGIDNGGKPLARVKPSIPVQVFRPGFRVRKLPVDLPNINNIRYREDGQLIALGYDGNVWKLSDSDDDGLADQADLFWKNQGQLRAPIGMALTPPGYSKGNGLFIAAKGKCTLLVDTDNDDFADKEIIVADGWNEIANHVDALGVAVDPEDESVFFGLGTTDYVDGYLINDDGVAEYTVDNDHGNIIKVAPDFKSREIYSTGIRFPVGLHFNRQGDLFCTDQEGATWLPNGNPFDEFLHLQKGRHYGFPPRHPKHLPDVIDEPSTYDYKPQHQSTCGFCFNEPVNANGRTFGPERWTGDAFVTGYSRGKLYRTELVKTGEDYVARNELFACLNQLTADCCITPDGGLLVACHSGGPDWGSGPAGRGTLFKIEYAQDETAQPVLAWPSGPREVRIEFDHPVDPEQLQRLAASIDITAGEFVGAGDSFESLWPGYAVVQGQHRTPRHDIRVYSAQLTSDRHALLLATDPLDAAVSYAVSIPLANSPDASDDSLPQQLQLDLAFNMTGTLAEFKRDNKVLWSGWLPSVDLAVSREWTAGSAFHDQLWTLLDESKKQNANGQLTMNSKLDLEQLLRPVVQPGSKLDFQWPDEIVTVDVNQNVTLAISDGDASQRVFTGIDQLVPVTLSALLPSDETVSTAIRYSTNEDSRWRPLPPSRSYLPWVTEQSSADSEIAMVPEEIAGGDWNAGYELFHHAQTGCAKCHTVNGKGGQIGPDLSNLIHRDYASVYRDVTQPSFAINPDYLVSTLLLEDGRVLTGSIRTVEGKLHVGDSNGKTTIIDPDEVERLQPSLKSIMPEGLLDQYSPQQIRDLMTFLLTHAPAEPEQPIDGR
ncbi:c-type cytochrome [Rhodopirellula sp. MGV]|uniref:DUF7133 domain-containing protein n=1 Tax=Rhodopirellula sp. MGV TaxID=2023130 RepID=UPI0013046343|nr:c-type cytochrome [Rhodopirellula sp. MGV]